MMKSSVQITFAALALAATGCGLSPKIPDAAQVAAAKSSGKTFDAFARSFQQGDAEWAKRAEGPDHIRAAIKGWEQAYIADQLDRHTLDCLCLAHYYLANYYTPDKKERQDTHLKGRFYGLESIRLNPAIRNAMDVEKKSLEEAIELHAQPGDVPAIYWMTVNTARAAELEGFATIAGMAPTVKRIMERLYLLGPAGYYWGGVHRFFGAYYTKAPAESDKANKSKKEFELAVQEGPENLENTVLMAEYYAKFVQDRDLYEKLLKGVLATDPAKDIPELRLDNAEARNRAKKMLENIDEDF